MVTITAVLHFVKKPRRRDYYVKSFEGASLKHASQLLRTFVDIRKDAGWKLKKITIQDIQVEPNK